MADAERKDGPGSGGPDGRIVYAVIAIAVVVLAVVLVMKIGGGTSVIDPSGGQMSLVQRPAPTLVTPARPHICPPGKFVCSGTCVDLITDNNNCGSCGNVCTSGRSCSNGRCCGNWIGDPRNCGGVSCFVAAYNIYAPCGRIDCEPACLEILPHDADCSLTTGTDHVNFLTDTKNCGGCGFRCNASEICDRMKCRKP